MERHDTYEYMDEHVFHIIMHKNICVRTFKIEPVLAPPATMSVTHRWSTEVGPTVDHWRSDVGPTLAHWRSTDVGPTLAH